MIARSSQIQNAILEDSHSKTRPFDSPLAFNFLMFFTFILFVAPQNAFTFLRPLHLALISALLSMAVYVAATMTKRHRLTVGGSEIKLIAWLVVFAVISIPHSQWRGGSYDVLFETYLKSVVVFLLIANLLTSERRFHTFLWALTLYSGYNAVSGINAYRQGLFIAGTERIFGGGDSALTGNPNDLALTLNLIMPFIVYLFTSSKKSVQKLVTGTILITSVACVVITSSRGGAITLLSILLWYIWRKSGPRRIGALIGVSILIGVVLMLAPGGYSERVSSSFDFSKDQTGSADARWIMMKDGLRQTFEHPFGVGLGMNVLQNVAEGRPWNGVHNVYLEISTELGIIPALLFIVLLWKLIVRMARVRSDTKEKGKLHSLAGATECSLVAFAVAANFHPVAYNFYFYIIAGLAVALSEMARNASKDRASVAARSPMIHLRPAQTREDWRPA